MATKKASGKKRQSPSTERLLALALVRVCECVRLERALGAQLKAGDTNPEYESARTAERESIDDALKVLADNGYADLESIASRVAAINDQIQAALSMGDGKALALLGPALERAKRGLPPIAKAEKKTKATTERKVKVSKAVQEILDAFDSVTFVDAGAPNHIVTSIKADGAGKRCLVQFDNNDQWVNVNPKDLKPFEDSKGSGTPAVEGKLSDGSAEGKQHETS